MFNCLKLKFSCLMLNTGPSENYDTTRDLIKVTIPEEKLKYECDITQLIKLK